MVLPDPLRWPSIPTMRLPDVYEGPLFHPNAVDAKDATLALGAGAPRLRAAGLEDRMHLAPTIEAAITPTG